MVAPARAEDERQSIEELRNTVVNLLQALVDQGVISKEKAAQMVKQAQDKATASAAAAAKADEGAVRVPYVPQVVQDAISKKVEDAVKPAVVADVIKEAKEQKWGVPGAMPDWLSRIRVSGEVMLREEAARYASDNVVNDYLNFNAVNAAGGIVKAGPAAELNINEDRYRFRGVARLAFEATLTDSLKAGIRLSTGNTSDLVSPTQTLDGTAPYSFGVDNLYVRLDERNANQFPWLSIVGGRFNNPWFSPTDLIFHKQLTFNGFAATGRLGIGNGGADQSNLFVTLGATPVASPGLSSPLPAKDKALLAAQGGADLHFANDMRFKVAAAFYDYLNVQGRENAPNDPSNDWSAPQFFRTGNTVFDIRNDDDLTTNLFALASKFRLVNIAATYDIPFGSYSWGLRADAVKNFGFNESQIFRLTGQEVAPRVKGYQADIGFGYPTVLTAGAWRAYIGYRYLQRDAVIDAYTDSDFHEGGTDAKGYYIVGDYGVARSVWLRFRYLSANQIDGLTYGVDTIQVDLNTRF